MTSEPYSVVSQSPPGGSPIGLEEILVIARRNAAWLCAWTALWVGFASLHLYFAPAEYVAMTQVVLEPHRQTGPSAEGPSILDSARADSEVEVVKSEQNLRFVFDTLKISENPAFSDQPLGLFPRLLSLLHFKGSDGVAPTPESKSIAAFEAFRGRVDVRRIGSSYVLEIFFRAPSPAEAARLANAVTASYIRGQVNVRASAVGRGTEYLQDRITDLNTQQRVATDAVRLGSIPDMQFPDADARVVSAAVAPLYKSFPQSKSILGFAIAFALLSGVATIIARHSFDRTIRSRAQFKRALGFDCLAVFPRNDKRKSRMLQPDDIFSLMAFDTPHPEFARALRDLRTAILSTVPRAKPLAVGFVSCYSGEGRSVIAANLAFILAASGSPVVLIDGDFRKPTLSRLLAPSSEFGVSQLLADPTHTQSYLPEFPLMPYLDFVPAVRAGEEADPAVFIGSARMQKALVEMKSQRTVLVDLSPLSASSDALALGGLIDGVVLCAEVNRTTVDEVSEARRALEASHTRVLGVVLTWMPPRFDGRASRRA